MIVATFADADGLAHAQRRCEAARIGPTETYTPAPPPGAATGSPIPLVILCAGLLGAALSFGLQSYSTIIAWRFDIGGRPPLSWPSYIPTTFENAALIALVAGFVGFLAVNRMPRLYDPIDESAGMRRASRDRWVLRIASDDHAVLERAREMLLTLDPVLIEELPS